eukprot:4980998-Pleurochrysis_carterae.AAC.2
MRVVWHGQADGKFSMLAGVSVCLFQGLLCLFVGGTADCRVVAQDALRMKGEQSIPSPACMSEPARLRLHACACTPS